MHGKIIFYHYGTAENDLCIYTNLCLFALLQNNYTIHIFFQVKGDPYAKVNSVIIRQWQFMKLLCCIEKFVTSKRKNVLTGWLIVYSQRN